MPDNHDLDEQNSRKQAEQVYDGPGHDRGADASQVDSTTYSEALLGDSRLNSRGNAPVKAAVMQRAQQIHGNRAVQRVLQRSTSEATSTEEPIGERIRARAGGGSTLDGGVQRKLEAGIGADLSGVRVHTDGEADHMARSVDSVAFTTGNDIFFRSGAYDPGSDRGMHLLAHEATHTVQQSQGPVSGTPSEGGVSISDPSDSYEQAAEATASRVVSGGSPAPAQRMAGASGTAVQRESADEEEQMQQMRSSTYAGISVQRAAEEEEDMQPMRSSTYGSIPSVQRADEQEEDEKEQMQPMKHSTYVQRESADEDEQMQQMKSSTYGGISVQRAEEEEDMQTMRSSTYGSIPSVQRAPEEEELQTMRSSTYGGIALQRHEAEEEE